MILLSSNKAAFCSFTVPLNQPLSWLYLWWRAVKGIAEVIFSSKFPAVPMVGAPVGISPIQAFSTHFPSPCNTCGSETWLSKGTWTAPTSFWWGGSAGNPRWEQQAEHCWAPGAQGSSQAQGAEGVTCHPGTSHRVQLVFVTVCLCRKSSCGSKSWL